MRACCTTQGTLLSALWWPNGKDIQKKEDICKHIAVLLCYTIETNTGEGNGTPLQHSCLETSMDGGAWWASVHWVSKSRTRLSDFTFTFHFHAMEKEMATHSSVLAWRIPGTGEPGGLLSMGSHRVRHYWSDLAAAAAGWLINNRNLFLTGLEVGRSKTKVPSCLASGDNPLSGS